MQTHNKSINYAPSAPDALTARRLLRRYISRGVDSFVQV
jgi:hypothetical protein